MAEGRVEVSFATGNDALRNEDGTLNRYDACALLEEAAHALRDGRDRFPIIDANGNRVGELVVHGESEES